MSKTIINGIDVSECAYYNKDNEPYCCEVWENECEAQNCYFKQFKRLKQENEELKKRQITKNGFICDCEQNAKYKQALEEIREIAKKATNSKDCYIYKYAGRMYCEPILKKIDEVLNDR